MDDIARKVKALKFWRLELSSSIEKQTDTNARCKILYTLFVITNNVIVGYEYAFGNSRRAYQMMVEELDALQKSEAFEVFSKLNHSLEEPVVDEKTHERISTLYQVLNYLINL